MLRSTLDLNEQIRLIGTKPKAMRSKYVKDLVGMAPSLIDWRVNDHCFTITRLYAIYEHFIEELIELWLRQLRKHFIFSKLSDKVQERYIKGISDLLRNLGSRRIGRLNLKAIATALYEVAEDRAEYMFIPEAFLNYDQNLRMEVLSTVFTSCGLTDVESWLEDQPSLESFFLSTSSISSAGSIAGLPRATLQSLVEHRNDAAHGVVDVSEILSRNALLEYIDFIEVMLVAFADFAMWHLIQAIELTGSASAVGVLKERLANNIVIIESDDACLYVGQQLHAISKRRYRAVSVLSIQIDDVDYAQVDVGVGAAIEIGVRLDGRVSKSARLVYVPDDLLTDVTPDDVSLDAAKLNEVFVAQEMIDEEEIDEGENEEDSGDEDPLPR